MTINNFKTYSDDRFIYLSAEVEIRHKSEIAYIGISKKYLQLLDDSYNSFLAAFLLSASAIGENIKIEGPISPKLFNSVSRIINLVTSWDVGFKKIVVS